MTNTDKLKVKRTLMKQGVFRLDNKTQIIKHTRSTGNECSLKVYDGQYWQTVKCTYDIEQIFDIL